MSINTTNTQSSTTKEKTEAVEEDDYMSDTYLTQLVNEQQDRNSQKSKLSKNYRELEAFKKKKQAEQEHK